MVHFRSVEPLRPPRMGQGVERLVMKVLLVDDQTLFREGVALLLKSVMRGVEIAEAGNSEEAIALTIQRGHFDLALIDLNLPGTSGLDLIGSLREGCPELSIVALSSSDDQDSIFAAIDAGAMGFIPKSASSSELSEAITLVMAKGIALPSGAALSIGATGTESTGIRSHEPSSRNTRTNPSQLGLTPRQAAVLYLILQGKSIKVIAQELHLSSSTVKAHTSAALRALDVTTRTQAIVAAARLGLVFDPVSGGTLSAI
jgi:DNA-binding NarL/FixJ family response regulator